MIVILAKNAGFCMGVRNAFDVALDAARAGPVFTLGPLIHNPPALSWLADRGVRAVDPDALTPASGAELPPGSTLVVRAHGLPQAVLERVARTGLPLRDATCVHVRRNQQTIRDAVLLGRHVYLAADPGHAETVGLQGQVASSAVTLVPTAGSAGAVPARAPASLLAQTTFDREDFLAIAAVLRRRVADLEVHEQSICLATDRRQREVRELARSAEAVVVVGGRGSANSRRLAEIAGAGGKPVVQVERADELRPEVFSGITAVAVVAGASTPDWITAEVVIRLEKM